MKKNANFIGSALIIGALTVAPAAAQSSGQSGTTGQGSATSTGQGSSTSAQEPRSGTQSGQTTGTRSGGSQGQSDRDRDKTTSYGEKVGEDVPTQGTQTDQRGRTAAAGADQTGTLRGADRTFLVDAIEGNTAEIKLAELAQQKASSPEVRQLAQTIQQHHQQANDKLKSIASQVQAADNQPQLKPQHKQLQDRLSKLEGQEFDRAYAGEMVKEHEKDIQKYEKASKDLQHSALKSYATETLPTLKKHLEMARAAQAPAQRTR